MKAILLLSFLFIAFKSIAGYDFDLNDSLKQNDSITPEIALKSIYNKADNVIPTLQSLRGKVVVLDFWAVWCTPCVAAIPYYNELSHKYDGKVQIIGITDDPKSKIENFLSKKKIDYWIGIDFNGKTFKNYAVEYRPTVVLINKKGNMVFRGHEITKELLDEVLATDTIIPAQKKNIQLNNITAQDVYGSWSPGEDPLYNGVAKLLKTDYKRNTPIYQFCIRQSLYNKNKHGGYGFSSFKWAGITITNMTIKEILVFLNKLQSEKWVIDKTNNKNRYDVIYFKKHKSLNEAYREIQTELLNSLSIKLKIIKEERMLNILSLKNKSPEVLNRNEIPRGTAKLYSSIKDVASILEEKTNKLSVIDKSLGNKFIFTDKVNLISAGVSEIIQFLEKNGISVRLEKRAVDLFEIK